MNINEELELSYLHKMEKNDFDSYENICFICGISLDKNNKSKEHVFPQWMIKKYDLENVKYAFNEKSLIKYSQIIIPCCKECNTKHLSKLENKIKASLDSGYEAFNKLSDLEIIQWIGKIYYGIQFKKLQLKKNFK